MAALNDCHRSPSQRRRSARAAASGNLPLLDARLAFGGQALDISLKC